MIAVGRGTVEMVNCSIDKGANVDKIIDDEYDVDCERAEDLGGALQHAAAEGHLECIKTLIERGADVDLMDSNGFTALERSSEQWRDEMKEAFMTSRRLEVDASRV